FYCNEDASMYSIEDEEIEFEDNRFVSILHPIHLEKEKLSKWKDKLYEIGLITIFPQIDRRLFEIKKEEKELNRTKHFFNTEVPKGADFVNSFLVRKNWIKSPGDGGHSEFTKKYKDGLFQAYANIEGPTVFYQGDGAKATVFEITFMGKNWQDKCKLKDIPAIFYSEVLSDINDLINAN
ncbi:MAG: DUF4132 domain-containing protein, partial [Bacteroidales bacterium]|nr:DUF4132 domain-containing protein [Bacteroidales bacterium]